MKFFSMLLMLILGFFHVSGQDFVWENNIFESINVKAAVVNFRGEHVLRVERDLKALPFNEKNLAGTVDEPTFVKLKNVYLKNGVIEVKVLSTIQKPSPFASARGFIGLAYHINENDSAFESIYLRPQLGRSDDQLARNHTVQYFAYPDFKFDRLRKEAPGKYETYADIGLDEWISLRLEVNDGKSELFINNQKHPSFVVADSKGKTSQGKVALWVDIATIGYFKDFKITIW